MAHVHSVILYPQFSCMSSRDQILGTRRCIIDALVPVQRIGDTEVKESTVHLCNYHEWTIITVFLISIMNISNILWRICIVNNAIYTIYFMWPLYKHNIEGEIPVLRINIIFEVIFYLLLYRTIVCWGFIVVECCL